MLIFILGLMCGGWSLSVLLCLPSLLCPKLSPHLSSSAKQTLSFLSGVAEQFRHCRSQARAWSLMDIEDSTDESYDEDFAGGN